MAPDAFSADFEWVGLDEGDPSRVGPYLIREKIYESKTTVVYKGEWESIPNAFAALKAYKPDFEGFPYELVGAKEAVKLGPMGHPHIARLMEVYMGPYKNTEKPIPYYCMEWVDGPPMIEIVKSLDHDRIIDSFIQLFSAMGYLHQAKWKHGDIKPSNILYDLEAQAVKLIDFGIHSYDYTPGFKAPELEKTGITIETDMYQVGRLIQSYHEEYPMPKVLLDICRECQSPEPGERPKPWVLESRLKTYRWKSKARAWFWRGSWAASVGLMMLLGFSYLLGVRNSSLEPFQVEMTGAARIAILPCTDSDQGGLMPTMINRALDESATLRPLPLGRMRQFSEKVSGCEDLTIEDMIALAFSYKVDFILSGRTYQESDQFHYNGVMAHKSGTYRSLSASSGSKTKLADKIVALCLEAVGSEERAVPVNVFFSDNLLSGHYYSDGVQLLESGNNTAALEFFSKAIAYDDRFVMAKLKKAEALSKSGRLNAAEALVDGLLNDPTSPERPLIHLNILKLKTDILYARYDSEALETLLQQTLDWSQSIGMSEKAVYFAKALAQLLYEAGRIDEARESAALVAAFAEQRGEPEQVVDLHIIESNAAFRGKAYDAALASLDTALSLAEEHGLLGRRFEIVSRMTRVLLKLDDHPAIDEHLILMEHNAEEAELFGDITHKIKLKYWNARCLLALGRDNEAFALLETVALDGRTFGVLEFEFKANMLLLDRHLDRNQPRLAVEVIQRFEGRVGALPSSFAMVLQSRATGVYFKVGGYEKALTAAESHYLFAEQLGSTPDMGRALNRKGVVLKGMGRLEEAEQAYLASLELLLESRDRDRSVCIENLIGLYTILGKNKQSQYYQDLLTELKNEKNYQGRSP